MFDTLETTALNGKMQRADDGRVTVDFVAKMHNQVLFRWWTRFVRLITFLVNTIFVA